jgi:UDP-3-O-[3-hydroxymyristoyl] glucosamine N-acyltransferase
MLVAFYDAKFLRQMLRNPSIACVISSSALAERVPAHLGLVTADDPKLAFYEIHRHLLEHTEFYWKDFPSEISSEAVVHERAYVAARNVCIGAGTVIEANAVVQERVIIGANVVVRAGVVVGGEGFEPKNIGGRKVIVRHAGGVLLHDRVEVQSNSHLARAVFGTCTEVGKDTKIDALVHIAHNVCIGKACEIAAGAIVAGSVSIGDRVWIGPGAVISSEITIGNDASISLGAVVIQDVPEGQRVSGNFAMEHNRFLRLAHFCRTSVVPRPGTP